MDPAEFFMVAQAAKQFDKRLYTNMRKELRLGADVAVRAIKEEIGKIPSSGRRRHGIRLALQKGTRASIAVASARTAGARIITSGHFLPEGKRPLVKALNKEKFRHPVFPDSSTPRTVRERQRGVQRAESWVWVEQAGRPYFGAAISKERAAIADGVRLAISRTIDQTARDIAAMKGRSV